MIKWIKSKYNRFLKRKEITKNLFKSTELLQDIFNVVRKKSYYSGSFGDFYYCLLFYHMSDFEKQEFIKETPFFMLVKPNVISDALKGSSGYYKQTSLTFTYKSTTFIVYNNDRHNSNNTFYQIYTKDLRDVYMVIDYPDKEKVYPSLFNYRGFELKKSLNPNWFKQHKDLDVINENISLLVNLLDKSKYFYLTVDNIVEDNIKEEELIKFIIKYQSYPDILNIIIPSIYSQNKTAGIKLISVMINLGIVISQEDMYFQIRLLEEKIKRLTIEKNIDISWMNPILDKEIEKINRLDIINNIKFKNYLDANINKKETISSKSKIVKI